MDFKTNQLADKDPYNNIILTDDMQLSLNPVKTGKNLNVCVFGGAGTGKTQNYVLPNVLQANTSYVITDQSGYLLNKTGKFLKEQGYIIKVLNLNDIENSNHYNPFDYVYDKDGVCNEAAVTRMVEMILAKPKTAATKTSLASQITDDMMCVLVSAICFYLFEMESKENRNFQNVIRLLGMSVSELDEIFLMPDEKIKLLCLQRYMLFRKSANTEVVEVIRIEALNRLGAFTQTNITNLTQFDDMELDLIGDRKTAIFITLPTFNHSLNFLTSVLITQIFNVLCSRTETLPNNKLPIHVRFMLDEFANCGYIPDFEKYSTVCVSHNISVNIILQDIDQLKSYYKSYWGIILNNCDSRLYLGGSMSFGTLHHISETVGSQMSVDELIAINKNNKCVLYIRDLPIFCGNKFDVEQHFNYGKIEE